MDIKKKHKILEAIDSKEYFNITTLAKNLNMPRTTVVYYINLLDEEGLIEKYRGNIRKRDLLKSESKTSDKYELNKEAKEKIAAKAVKNIEKGDIIFLDGGSTTTYMIQHLYDMDIIIYTNNISLVEKVPGEGFKPKLFVVPGEVYKRTSTITGSLAIRFIANVFIDKAFLGANAVIDNKFLTTNQDESEIKAALINNAKQSYILYDKSKIGLKTSKYIFADKAIRKEIKEVVS